MATATIATGVRPRSTTPCSATTWPTPSAPRTRRGSRRPCATRPSSAPSSRTSARTAPTARLHTLGAIWHRARLTCPSRQQLGSFLLDALDPELAAYLQFHIEVVECPFCQANLADLKAQSEAAAAAKASKTRQHRILQSSQHLLGSE